MGLFAQCGFGRSNKIQEGLGAGIIQGAILSPRDETKEKLKSFAAKLTDEYANAIVMFDPQFYAATINGANDTHLQEYKYYGANLSRINFAPDKSRRYVEKCLDYQNGELGKYISYIVSPTVLFDGFRDSWSQISLDMAGASREYWTKLRSNKPLLISLVFSETALSDRGALEEFLNAITELDVAGFYIIVRRNASSLSHALNSQSFAHLMYMTHVLTNVNRYLVIFGYTDWYGFLLESVGADYTASGWYQNLRQFSYGRFLPSSGGRRPKRRYSSLQMLSCPLIIPDLQEIYQAGRLRKVLAGTSYDGILAAGPAAGESDWSDEISCLHHWANLAKLSGIVKQNVKLADRLDHAQALVRNARGVYSSLDRHGITIEATTGPHHLAEWQSSIREFRSIVGV